MPVPRDTDNAHWQAYRGSSSRGLRRGHRGCDCRGGSISRSPTRRNTRLVPDISSRTPVTTEHTSQQFPGSGLGRTRRASPHTIPSLPCPSDRVRVACVANPEGIGSAPPRDPAQYPGGNCPSLEGGGIICAPSRQELDYRALGARRALTQNIHSRGLRLLCTRARGGRPVAGGARRLTRRRRARSRRARCCCGGAAASSTPRGCASPRNPPLPPRGRRRRLAGRRGDAAGGATGPLGLRQRAV